MNTAESICWKLMDQANHGYVSVDMGCFDLTIDLTDEEEEFLRSISHEKCQDCGEVNYGDATYGHYLTHHPLPSTAPKVKCQCGEVEFETQGPNGEEYSRQVLTNAFSQHSTYGECRQ